MTDDIKWDYLRSPSGKVVRRREVTDLDQDQWTDHLHFNDAQRTVKNEEEVSTAIAQPDIGYAVSAAGEPLPVSAVTSTDENHIQWQGAFLEDKELNTAADSDRGYLSRMGVRHYSPAFGRFLQRDPVNNYRAPNPMFPLAHNPYQYAYNQPTQYSDTSGYQCCGLGGGGAGTLGGHNLAGVSKDLNPEGQEVDPGNCIIPWPDNSGCFPKTCYMCCVGKNGIEADPWCDAVCLIPYYGDMTNCECHVWCENAKYGGENHPSPMGDVPSGGNRRPIYGPPSYGPGGDGGDRPWILPLYPIPGNGFPERLPWELMLSLDLHSPLGITEGIHTFSSSYWVGPTNMTQGALTIGNLPRGLIPPPEWKIPTGMGIVSWLTNRGIGFACDLLGLLGVNPYNPSNPCSLQGDLWQCIRGACCIWSKCVKAAGTVSTITGLLVGIITWNFWAGWGSASVVYAAGTLACGIAAMAMVISCL